MIKKNFEHRNTMYGTFLMIPFEKKTRMDWLDVLGDSMRVKDVFLCQNIKT